MAILETTPEEKTNLIDLIRMSETEIDLYLSHVSVKQFKKDIRALIKKASK